MALTYSEPMAIGTHAPNFSLKGTDDRAYSLSSFVHAKVLVVIFTCNHCPYAQAVEGRLIELQQHYGPKGAQLVLINSNDSVNYPDDGFDKMKQRASEKSYPFPYLFDETQEVARAYNAVCTPDIYVFDGERKLQYHGRVDDNWKEPEKVTRRELAEALDSILSGKSVSFEPQPSMGCNIKWKESTP